MPGPMCRWVVVCDGVSENSSFEFMRGRVGMIFMMLVDVWRARTSFQKCGPTSGDWDIIFWNKWINEELIQLIQWIQNNSPFTDRWSDRPEIFTVASGTSLSMPAACTVCGAWCVGVVVCNVLCSNINKWVGEHGKYTHSLANMLANTLPMFSNV